MSVLFAELPEIGHRTEECDRLRGFTQADFVREYDVVCYRNGGE